MQAEVARVEPAASPPPAGARRRSTSGPAYAPSSSAPASRWSTSPAAPASRADLYSHRRDGAAAGRLAGLIRVAGGVSRARRARAGLAAVRERIAGACAAAGRDPATITLVVVTKFFPASDVRILADLGVTDVGENRHQEAEAKAAECADLGLRGTSSARCRATRRPPSRRTPTWCSPSTGPSWSAALSRGAHERGRDLDVPGPGRPRPARRRGRARRRPGRRRRPRRARRRPPTGCVLRGVMAVAPLGDDPAEAFARLADVAADVRRAHPEATWISAGMSGDLEHAVRAGATHLRDRLGGPRSEARGQVMSGVVTAAPSAAPPQQ